MNTAPQSSAFEKADHVEIFHYVDSLTILAFIAITLTVAILMFFSRQLIINLNPLYLLTAIGLFAVCEIMLVISYIYQKTGYIKIDNQVITSASYFHNKTIPLAEIESVKLHLGGEGYSCIYLQAQNKIILKIPESLEQYFYFYDLVKSKIESQKTHKVKID